MFELENDPKILKKWASNSPKFLETDWPRDIDFLAVIEKYFSSEELTEKEIIKISVLIDYYSYVGDLIRDWEEDSEVKVLRTLDDFFEEFMKTQNEYIESLILDWGLGLWKKSFHDDDPGRILWDGFCDLNWGLKLVQLG
jgi:hypothetical protein